MRAAVRFLAGLAGLIAPLHGASPADAWSVSKASSNLGVPALSAAELAQRKISLVDMGLLDVPTGEIVAADPLVTPDRPPFARKVAPGRYPVVLYRAQGRTALAMLRFASGAPVRWELATVAGQDVATLKDDEIFGYPVDAGTGCFMDKAAYPLMLEREKREIATGAANFNYYDDVLAKDYPGERDGEFVLHVPLPESPLNVAVFSSGWGDGFYASFWGLDASGEPLVLMTDFGVLEDADGRNDYERENAVALTAVAEGERAAIAAAFNAVKTDDLAALQNLLDMGDVKPDSYIYETGNTLTLETIAYVKPKALELMVRYGVRKEIPEGISGSLRTYPDYARGIMQSLNPSSPVTMELRDVVERWEAGEIPQREPRQ
jgi:hypothetical protein